MGATGADVTFQDADHPVIKLGSSGPNVETWQKVIGVTPDGKFGPQTEVITRQWQQAHGITADGIVGPLTWSAASVRDIIPAGGFLISDVKTAAGVGTIALIGAAIGGPIGFAIGGAASWFTRSFWRAKL